MELLLASVEQLEALDWTDKRRACGSTTVPNYRTTQCAGRVARKTWRISGYERSGTRICTKRWTSYARSLISILTSAWSVCSSWSHKAYTHNEAGHRISRCCCSTHRRLQLESLVPLPDRTMQRRPPEDNTARSHTILSKRRHSPHTTRHIRTELQAQVFAPLRQQHRALPLHMDLQLQVLARRRHVQRRVDTNVEEIRRRL